ncbi:MAG: ABC transporter substrate-binding protein, partial [Candidatus Promineifilaceae bacterium]
MLFQHILKPSGRPRALLCTALLLGFISLYGCKEPEEGPIVVTEVATVGGQEVIVTRIVHQTQKVEITPVVMENPDPILLDISLGGEITTLDPQLSAGEPDIQIIDNIFAGLTRYNPKTNTIDPELAEDWEVSDDGLTWTFKLRDDIYWIRWNAAEGLIGSTEAIEPQRLVTAHDVEYSIQRACSSELATPDVFVLFIIEGCEQAYESGGQSGNVTGVRAIDAQTLEIKLTEPASHFLTMTSTLLLIPVPSDLVDEMGEEWSLSENIITSGPFALSPESLMDRRIVLDRNPYWPIPFEGNVDTVNILLLEPADAYQLWRNRNLDLSQVPRSEQANILNQHEGKAILVPNQAVFYLAYNADSPVFSIPEIRRAFSWAIDRERLIREVHGSRGYPLRHLAPPGVVASPNIDEIGVGYSPDKARQQMNNSPFNDCRLMP